MTSVNFRDPKSTALRGAVGIRQEDVLETLLGSPKLQPFAGAIGQSDWLNLVVKLVEILGPVLAAAILQKLNPKAPDAPPPVLPTPSPAPAPVPVPPAPAAAVKKIVGGRAKITGLTEGGPLGKRWSGQDLENVLIGVGNAPHDARFEFDCTPQLEDLSFLGPDDPRWAGQPGAKRRPTAGDTDGPMQPMRLRFTYKGDGSADLAHEYANFGCNPRIRVRTPGIGGGILSDIYFEGPDYGGGEPIVIEVAEGPIFIGRGAPGQ